MKNSKLLIAFYSNNQSSPLDKRVMLAWWHWTHKVCQTLGVTLTHIEVTIKSDDEEKYDPKRCKGYIYKNSQNRIYREIDLEKYSSIGLNSLDDPKGYISMDCALTSWMKTDIRFGNYICLGIDLTMLPKWSRSSILGLIEQCLNVVIHDMQVDYGFAVIMPYRFDPIYYTWGIATGETEQRLIYDANAWLRFARQDCHKYLRNVFGWNLLSKEHLSIDVNGETLESWIQQKPRSLTSKIFQRFKPEIFLNRGKLIPMQNDLTCWTFEDDTENMDFLKWEHAPVEQVRSHLEQFKIFPWQSLPD